MADKVLYELVCGKAPGMPTGDGDELVDMEEGDTIESSVNLAKMWPQKFVRVDRTEDLVGSMAKRRNRRLITKTKTQATSHQNVLAKDSQPDEDVDEVMNKDEGDDTRKPRNAKTVAKASSTAKVQEEEGDDVSEDFDLAVKNDLKVTHSTKGYTIRDGKKTVTDTPLRTKTQVTAKLKEYAGEE